MAWYDRFLPRIPQETPSFVIEEEVSDFPWPDPAQHTEVLTAAGERLQDQRVRNYRDAFGIYFPNGNLNQNGPNSPATMTTATDRLWQAEAWDLVMLVPPMNYLVSTLAQRLGLARWFLAESPTIRGAFRNQDDDHVVTEPPQPLKPSDRIYEDAQKILSRLAPDEEAFSEQVIKMGYNLYTVGEGFWMPPCVYSEYYTVHSPSELWFTGNSYDAAVTVFYGQGRQKSYPSLRASHGARTWDPNPQYSWLAHSSVKSLLPALRTYVGLNMHLAAQIDSRLAGAGLLVYSQDIEDAMRRQEGLDPDDTSNPFAEQFTETAMTAMKDRASAAANVPMLVGVPGESVQHKFEYLTFAKPMDQELVKLQQEATSTIALGMDCPPELLTGAAKSSHWSAWLTRDDVIASHLVPKLKMIANAITKTILRPLLVEEFGYTYEEASRVMIWFSTDGMALRPNRTEDAKILYDRHEISGAALRQAYGFSLKDAPEWASLPPAWSLAYQLVIKSPQLVANPGLPAIVQAFEALLEEDFEKLPEQTPVISESHSVSHDTPETLPSSTQPRDESHNPARSDGPPRSAIDTPHGRNSRGDVSPDSREHPVSESGPHAPQRTPA